MISIEDIVNELYSKYNIPKADLSRIVKSQFKLTKNIIISKGSETCNLIYLGKFKNTKFRSKQLKEILNE